MIIFTLYTNILFSAFLLPAFVARLVSMIWSDPVYQSSWRILLKVSFLFQVTSQRQGERQWIRKLGVWRPWWWGERSPSFSQHFQGLRAERNRRVRGGGEAPPGWGGKGKPVLLENICLLFYFGILLTSSKLHIFIITNRLNIFRLKYFSFSRLETGKTFLYFILFFLLTIALERHWLHWLTLWSPWSLQILILAAQGTSEWDPLFYFQF